MSDRLRRSGDRSQGDSAEEGRLVGELRGAGHRLRSVWDWANDRVYRPDALPILLRWLECADDEVLVEAIARAITDRRYRGNEVAGALTRRFPRVKRDSVRWAIANAIVTVGFRGFEDEVLGFVQHREFGDSRELLVGALHRVNRAEVEPLLISLLEDRRLDFFAIESLVKVGGAAGLAALESLDTSDRLPRTRKLLPTATARMRARLTRGPAAVGEHSSVDLAAPVELEQRLPRDLFESDDRETLPARPPDYALIDGFLERWDRYSRGDDTVVPSLDADVRRFNAELARAVRSDGRRGVGRAVFYAVVQVAGFVPADSELGRALEGVFRGALPKPRPSAGGPRFFAGDLYRWWQSAAADFERYPRLEAWASRPENQAGALRLFDAIAERDQRGDSGRRR